MKKFVMALIAALMLAGCGVGLYSVSSGKADEGMISFVSETETPLSVFIDQDVYAVYTVKAKAWHKDRNIKKTARNTIILAPGQHKVVVSMDGKEVCNKEVFISAQEHKVIELRRNFTLQPLRR